MRDETDQRYKIDNKMLDELGYGVKKVKEAIRWWYKAAVGPIWFKVERIFGQNGVNGHQVCEQKRVSSITGSIDNTNMVGQTINHAKCNYKLINT